MIDVLEVKPTEAVLSGEWRRTLSGVTVSRNRGEATVEYPLVEPSTFVVWKGAELGLVDPSTDAVKVRLSDGANQYFIDEDENLVINEVADPDDWSTDFMPAHLLGNLDLWTRQKLQVIVRLEGTSSDPVPSCGGLSVLMDLPTWEGAVMAAVRAIATAVVGSRPVLVHRLVATEQVQEIQLGDQFSEHAINLATGVTVVVNGLPKSATVQSGKVVLNGPPAPAGSVIEIAVQFAPTIAVRRGDESRQVHRTPEWVLTDLVRGGGLNGQMPSLDVNGRRVYRRRVDLRIMARGVANRQAEAFAMRAALQSVFQTGLRVTFPSCRQVIAFTDSMVEVLKGGGSLGLPEAVGVVRCPLV